MVSQLFEVRARKAVAGQRFFQLLPEERYVCSMQRRFGLRGQALLDALSEGRPSFIEFANRRELSRSTTVRFVKHVNEIVGADLRRYGPFEENDIASIPATNADILLAEGDALEVNTRDES
jgi:DNA replication factor GINS